MHFDHTQNKQKIGFIGQGWIGKHMADNFEERGYQTVRYSLEEPYIKNKDAITECDVVFIAVPTPSTPKGFSFDAVESALQLVGLGKIAVIKSTLLPGTTRKLQENHPEIIVMHSPEFLREKFAADDTKHPTRNIIGVVNYSHMESANMVMQVLPWAPYKRFVTAESAECIKYIGNNFLYTKIVFFNIMHDIVKAVGADWDQVRESVVQDERIGESHTQVLDQSGENTTPGRGAGGHCFVKDFEAMLGLLEDMNWDEPQLDALFALRDVNNKLLINTNKDIDILEGVYGKIK